MRTASQRSHCWGKVEYVIASKAALEMLSSAALDVSLPQSELIDPADLLLALSQHETQEMLTN